MSDPYGERPDRPQSSGPDYGRPPADQPVHEQETRAQRIPEQPQQQPQQPPQQGGHGYGPGYGQYGSGVYGQSGGGPNLSKQPQGQQYGQQPYPYGQQGQQYGAGQPPYGAPYGGGTPYVAQPQSQSNGLAIASLITSLCGIFFCGIPALVGIGLGIAGLNQAKRTGTGRGMAIAGIVIGAVIVALAIIGIIAIAIDSSNSTSSG